MIAVTNRLSFPKKFHLINSHSTNECHKIQSHDMHPFFICYSGIYIYIYIRKQSLEFTHHLSQSNHKTCNSAKKLINNQKKLSSANNSKKQFSDWLTSKRTIEWMKVNERAKKAAQMQSDWIHLSINQTTFAQFNDFQ